MISIGIDTGAISVKLAVVYNKDNKDNKESKENQAFFEHICSKTDGFFLSKPFLLSKYRRIKGDPIKLVAELLEELEPYLDESTPIRLTGSVSRVIAQLIQTFPEDDFQAVAYGVGSLYPKVKTIFEMGGDASKYIRIDVDEQNGGVEILDYEKSGECAAGTGSFIDQQANRLQYAVEDVGDIVMSAKQAATIAGRCSVFAKTDMIHAQQKGYQPPEILKGLCDAVARNFKGSIAKGKKIVPQVAFIGGVAANKGVVCAMKDAFGLSDEEFFVPKEYAWLSAIGVGLLRLKTSESESESESNLSNLKRRGCKLKDSLSRLQVYSQKRANFPIHEPLSTQNVLILKNMVQPYSFESKKFPVDAYLGLDIGSVSTNLAVLDSDGNLIKEIYTRTRSRPIEVVNEGLKEIYDEIGDKIKIRGVGATGSGRELIGKLVGADTINDEITAHKTGATYIGIKFIGEKPDTIFEIGGQDSKFIRIEDGVIVDFAMNEACAAGTGSFLEEQSERLGISIINEFAQLAFSSNTPILLGERCTVFMEKELVSYLQRGATVEDLVAGLAYSIATNYLNRVVRGRKIGDKIYFQGGTAYNDSVAAAFATILKKRIIVPPYNGVIGAIGMALLAQEKVVASKKPTSFRGFRLDDIDYTLKQFTCKACSNFCDIQEFRVEGERTYWGDKCSDQFRKRPKVDKKPLIDDLITKRNQLLIEGYEETRSNSMKIGIPRAFYFFDRFPFYNAFFSQLGLQAVISSNSSRSIAQHGIENAIAQPCFPIKIAHGHIYNLIQQGKEVDYIFLPNIVDDETEFSEVPSHLCPWTQTFPFVIAQTPMVNGIKAKFLSPTIHFKAGFGRVYEEHQTIAKNLGVTKGDIKEALKSAYDAQNSFKKKLLEMGEEALQRLLEKDELGIVLVGRMYNLYDSGMNLDIPRKLRDYYAINMIPIDLLPLDKIDISQINNNMYWHCGRKIIQAAKLVSEFPNLHIIYITNFKCGPDSYIKHYIVEASKKPFLSLQFDGHGNDAGYLTRCEAYLNSKGFLRE